jgi:ferredoxin
MKNNSYVNHESCKRCGLCAEVCPNRIMIKDSPDKISFRTDRLHQCFRCGQCMAICPTKSMHIDGLSYTSNFFELPRDGSFERPFFDMIATRRAIRNFKEKPVPRELLERVVEAISFAPPGFPPIKTEIVVVENTDIIRRALPHMIEMYDFLVKAMGNPMIRYFIKRRVGREKFTTIVNHVVPLMKSRLPELKMGTEDTLTRDAPAIIVFHADRTEENYKEDIYISLTYGFLAAHALGLGGSAMDIIPPTIERNRVLRKMFSIPDSNEVVASMILGYPKYRYQRAIKRELKSVQWI